ILLYHRPFLFDEAIKKGVNLQLAGHTHAGQIPPMEAIVWLYYKYPYGLYEKDGAYIYTTSGVGYWGPPMRFLVKPEIVEITLESTK
ncbi:MAG: metallophosphoesterase, partial [bacterium]|nr:metallophosphoesterase [bacterium]